MVCWLIRCDATIRTPGLTSPTKRNMKKYFSGDFISEILAKTLFLTEMPRIYKHLTAFQVIGSYQQISFKMDFETFKIVTMINQSIIHYFSTKPYRI